MSAPTPQQIQWYKEHASDNLQPNMIAAAVCGLVIAYSAVVLRVVARRASAARTGIDDWLIIAALLPLTGYAISIFLAVRYNGGRHIIFLTQPRSFIERYIAGITAYAVCVVLTKSSILCFYNRIFPSKVLLRVSWAFGLFIGAYNLALVLVTALQCIPLSSFWTHKPAKCIQTRSAFTILA